MGTFISFEGSEGVGKTTLIQAVAAHLQALGHGVVVTREPGGTPLAEQLRAQLLTRGPEPMAPDCELLLMFAARSQHLAQRILPALAQGQVVLCDRFVDATFAYQGGGRGFDWETLQMLEKTVLAQQCNGSGDECQLLLPDLTLWFDVPAATAAARLSGARTPDKFEAQSIQFFERVSEGYARRATESPRRFVRIDAARPVEDVWRQVIEAVSSRGWL